MEVAGVTIRLHVEVEPRIASFAPGHELELHAVSGPRCIAHGGKRTALPTCSRIEQAWAALSRHVTELPRRDCPPGAGLAVKSASEQCALSRPLHGSALTERAA